MRLRIVAAMSWHVVGKNTLLQSTASDRCAEIVLIGVKPRWQSHGCGQRLVSMLVDRDGAERDFQRLLVFSDKRTSNWFKRIGFTDDPVITGRYRKFTDEWEGSVLLVRALPLPVAHDEASLLADHVDSWKDNFVKAYSSGLELVAGLQAEVQRLKRQLHASEEAKRQLAEENVRLKQQAADLEAHFATFRKHARERMLAMAGVDEAAAEAGEGGEESKAEERAAVTAVGILLPSDSAEFKRIAVDISASVRPSHNISQLHVWSVIKRQDDDLTARFNAATAKFEEDSGGSGSANLATLYFGAAADDLRRIFEYGFSASDLHADPWRLAKWGAGASCLQRRAAHAHALTRSLRRHLSFPLCRPRSRLQ
eukprot:PLAT5341.2.p1 GENE.PLAT5341.2~~PLAT5341.2.p1  ORF type:complete len:413 (-),score=151.30 PLAT5341.2:315-1418(-)